MKWISFSTSNFGMDMNVKIKLLVVISIIFSASSAILATVSDVSGNWGTVEESGSLQRVPWRTTADIGLWTTCIQRVSGFEREEVWTSNCVSTVDAGYLSKDAVRICQISTVMTSLLATAGGVAGVIYVILTKSPPLLITASASAVFSVVVSLTSIIVFVTEFNDSMSVDWSYKLCIMSSVCNVLSSVGYSMATVKCIKTRSRVHNKIQEVT